MVWKSLVREGEGTVYIMILVESYGAGTPHGCRHGMNSIQFNHQRLRFTL